MDRRRIPTRVDGTARKMVQTLGNKVMGRRKILGQAAQQPMKPGTSVVSVLTWRSICFLKIFVGMDLKTLFATSVIDHNLYQRKPKRTAAPEKRILVKTHENLRASF